MPVIFDQWGQPMMISPQRHDFDADYGAAMADEPAAEETVTPAAHRLACDAARTEGHFQGIAEGRKAGAKAEGRRFMDVVRGCNGNDAKLMAALNLAVEFPEIPAAGCVDMAGKHFTNHRRGSASLAMRDQFPDSLALAMAQLAGA